MHFAAFASFAFAIMHMVCFWLFSPRTPSFSRFLFVPRAITVAKVPAGLLCINFGIFDVFTPSSKELISEWKYEGFAFTVL